ncbi:hypothetical protein Cycma_2505 [Cyclobacterium marinum DSM 745]|uniref:Uncharacterized protein n=1 Tax=Cyclobacterium marinum (strain ATCC 25205 / DSM 745 / LMG 13164 / NCIMB 1802) TaxID=880070 RepID=G0IW24_CYCMS|nr:hypothetical protein Cycma_2505 [Cyclobacterium marinum DSM 745]
MNGEITPSKIKFLSITIYESCFGLIGPCFQDIGQIHPIFLFFFAQNLVYQPFFGAKGNL